MKIPQFLIPKWTKHGWYRQFTWLGFQIWTRNNIGLGLDVDVVGYAGFTFYLILPYLTILFQIKYPRKWVDFIDKHTTLK